MHQTGFDQVFSQNSLPRPGYLRFLLAFICAVMTIPGAIFSSHAQQLFHDGSPVIERKDKAPAVELPRLTDLSRELSPTVVNISVEGPAADEGDEGESGKKKESAPLRSLGSGFLISGEGHIVTSNHVIEKSERIIVRLLDDKRDYPAKVVGRDPKTDIALLKIDPPGAVKFVYFGDSDALEIGEWVMAIGNQFQLGQSVTAGIVSAKSRRVPTGTGSPYDAFIQTDASINPGSSGGPLFNTKGQVVGINTAIFSPGRSQFGGTGFNIGIGFAIPVNLARGVITQLAQFGKVTRGLLGVLIQRVDNDIATIFSLETPDGALVSDVMKGSPAASAGFKRRDIIVKFGKTAIRDHEDLPLLVASTAIGTQVPVEVIRDGKPMILQVTIAELKDDALAGLRASEMKPNEIGVLVEGVTEELARALDLPEQRGVLVTTVEPGSAADRAGLSRGDVIEEFADKVVRNSKEFKELVSKIATSPADAKPGEPRSYLALVRRKEGVRYVVIKVG